MELRARTRPCTGATVADKSFATSASNLTVRATAVRVRVAAGRAGRALAHRATQTSEVDADVVFETPTFARAYADIRVRPTAAAQTATQPCAVVRAIVAQRRIETRPVEDPLGHRSCEIDVPPATCSELPCTDLQRARWRGRIVFV